MNPVVAFVRLFFVGGVISYRALFNWLRPSIYIPTMLGAPVFQILFFTYLGRFRDLESDAWFVVGNAVQSCSMAAVYAGTMTIANERWLGTLSPLLASPGNRAALFLGRSVPLLVNGLFVSAFGFAVSRLLLDFHPSPSSLPALGLVVTCSVASCTAFGLLLGSIGLRARDVLFGANLAYFLMLLFCGVNVPLDALPGWMSAIGRGLPLTHGIEAARDVAGGAALGSVSGLVWTELAIGAVYAGAAYFLFRYFERQSRHRASLETV
ncbi:MAG: ABC transporter permease [Gaiellaceae bacterium]